MSPGVSFSPFATTRTMPSTRIGGRAAANVTGGLRFAPTGRRRARSTAAAPPWSNPRLLVSCRISRRKRLVLASCDDHHADRRCSRTERRMRRLDLAVGEEVRHLRLDAGVTLSALSAVVGVHRTYLARIEAGRARPSLEVLTAIGVALGADLERSLLRRLRTAARRPVPGRHDRGRPGVLLIPRWTVDLEVPVTTPSRGVIDLVLTDRTSPVAIAGEAQSELRRLEQQIRWSAEKAEGLAERLSAIDQGQSRVPVSRLLVLRSTVNDPGDRQAVRERRSPPLIPQGPRMSS